MKKIITLLLVTIIVCSLIYLYEKSKHENEKEVIKEQPSVEELLLNNGYSIDGYNYIKEESNTKFVFNFDKEQERQFKLCETENEKDCFTYYWEQQRAVTHYCSYNAKTGVTKTVESHCSESIINRLKNFSNYFSNLLKNMDMTVDKLDEIKIEV
jgi:uncharacterized protein YxeA